MTSDLQQFTLPSLNQMRGFSFGASNQYPKIQRTSQFDVISNQNNLLKKQNQLLNRQKARLEEENRSLKDLINTKRSRTPSNKNQLSGRQTPDNQTTKDKTRVKTLETSSRSVFQQQGIQEDRLEQAQLIIESKTKVITKLEKKLKVLEEINKYQLQMIEQQYQNELQQKSYELQFLKSEILSVQQKLENRKINGEQKQQSKRNSVLQQENRRLKSKINKMIEQSSSLNRTKLELQEIVYELYYQVETYSQQSEAIQNIKNHFSLKRAVFDKRTTKQHLEKQ